MLMRPYVENGKLRVLTKWAGHTLSTSEPLLHFSGLDREDRRSIRRWMCGYRSAELIRLVPALTLSAGCRESVFDLQPCTAANRPVRSLILTLIFDMERRSIQAFEVSRN
jgi:hypothetical protein